MNSDASIKIVQAMYESAARGDQAGFIGSLDDKIVVHEPSFLPYGGQHHGKDGFLKLIGEVFKHMDPASLRVDSYVAEGDVVVAFISLKSLKDGSNIRLAERSVVSNGKVVEMKIFFHEFGAMSSVIKR